MPPITQLLIAIAVIATAIAYSAGYFTAWHTHQEERARNRKIQLRLTRERNEMAAWVQTNWPSEFQAYKSGIADGYQQGVTQANSLDGFHE
jgi:Flp pilus assembly protein TadB